MAAADRMTKAEREREQHLVEEIADHVTREIDELLSSRAAALFEDGAAQFGFRMMVLHDLIGCGLAITASHSPTKLREGLTISTENVERIAWDCFAVELAKKAAADA
jgi:hypothetical protein